MKKKLYYAKMEIDICFLSAQTTDTNQPLNQDVSLVNEALEHFKDEIDSRNTDVPSIIEVTSEEQVPTIWLDSVAWDKDEPNVETNTKSVRYLIKDIQRKEELREYAEFLRLKAKFDK
jgi:hypothetical protein